MEVLSRYKREDFDEVIRICKQHISIDNVDDVYQSAREAVSDKFTSGNLIKELQARWYQSLRNGVPDFSVYNDSNYFADIWSCWVMYSRKNIGCLANRMDKLQGRSVVEYISTKKNVLDLGCGFGYTTAGAREIFPSAGNVYGSNLDDTWQFKVAAEIGRRHDFTVVGDIFNLVDIDVVCAFEYFEHIHNPIEHVYEIITKLRPRFIVTANAFNGIAIGHFTSYGHMDKTFSPKKMNLIFNKALRYLGYEKLDTNFWNGRPRVWKFVGVKK